MRSAVLALIALTAQTQAVSFQKLAQVAPTYEEPSCLCVDAIDAAPYYDVCAQQIDECSELPFEPTEGFAGANYGDDGVAAVSWASANARASAQAQTRVIPSVVKQTDGVQSVYSKQEAKAAGGADGCETSHFDVDGCVHIYEELQSTLTECESECVRGTKYQRNEQLCRAADAAAENDGVTLPNADGDCVLIPGTTCECPNVC